MKYKEETSEQTIDRLRSDIEEFKRNEKRLVSRIEELRKEIENDKNTFSFASIAASIAFAIFWIFTCVFSCSETHYVKDVEVWDESNDYGRYYGIVRSVQEYRNYNDLIEYELDDNVSFIGPRGKFNIGDTISFVKYARPCKKVKTDSIKEVATVKDTISKAE